ncbi:MAG TPA: hypothetical protein VH481_08635 [Nitrososphaeraceae archaeon]|jgi:hypothetical protein
MVMFEGFEDCNIKNHISSSDALLLSVDESDIGVSVNQKQNTSPSVEVNRPSRINDYAKLTKGKNFLICDSCLWCASYFEREMNYAKCPVCKKGKIEYMPIRDEEWSIFDHSDNRGIELISNKIRS